MPENGNEWAVKEEDRYHPDHSKKNHMALVLLAMLCKSGALLHFL